MRRMVLSALFFALAVSAHAPRRALAAEEVYLTPEQALKWAFPGCEAVEKRELQLSSEQRGAIEKESGGKWFPGDRVVYCGKSGGRVQGYAIITNEIGKFEPITFIVKATPDGKVADAAVMVYRECRGGEVQRRRFLHQFKGKTKEDPIKINSDILNVTGATMSVRAMSRGVKKTLLILDRHVLNPLP